MTQATITFGTTPVHVNIGSTTASVNTPSSAPVEFDGSAGVGGTGGAGGGGDGDGATGRVYTHTSDLNANARVYIGSENRMERVPNGKFVIASATLTLNTPVYDTDKIEVDQ